MTGYPTNKHRRDAGLDITVIIATHDRPDWLAVSVRSIQTSAQFAALHGIRTRILVVDDASPGEATAEVCRALGADYLRNLVNDGRNDPSEARMLGLAAADSPFYALFDDDDVMSPRFLLAHMQAMSDGVDVVYSGYWFVDAELRPTRRVLPYRANLGDMLHNHNAINDHTLVRRDAIDGVWRPELEKAMMFGGYLEMLYRGCRFVRLGEPTYLYRRHDRNMSDEVDPRFTAIREELVAAYRARVLERDGRLPVPSSGIRVRELAGPRLRGLVRRVRRAIT